MTLNLESLNLSSCLFTFVSYKELISSSVAHIVQESFVGVSNIKEIVLNVSEFKFINDSGPDISLSYAGCIIFWLPVVQTVEKGQSK